jgi:hypothetical protein
LRVLLAEFPPVVALAEFRGAESRVVVVELREAWMREHRLAEVRVPWATK